MCNVGIAHLADVRAVSATFRTLPQASFVRKKASHCEMVQIAGPGRVEPAYSKLETYIAKTERLKASDAIFHAWRFICRSWGAWPKARKGGLNSLQAALDQLQSHAKLGTCKPMG